MKVIKFELDKILKAKIKKNEKLLTTVIATIGFAFISTAQTLPNNVPTEGLIVWWPFDGDTNDSSIAIIIVS